MTINPFRAHTGRYENRGPFTAAPWPMGSYWVPMRAHGSTTGPHGAHGAPWGPLGTLAPQGAPCGPGGGTPWPLPCMPLMSGMPHGAIPIVPACIGSHGPWTRGSN